MRTKKLFSAIAMAAGLLSLTATGCEVEYGATTFRCNPKAGGDNCPDGFQCCSDDPTVLGGQKAFSEQQNNLSSSGMCVDSGVNAGLTNGCPIPCNPLWAATTVTGICGGDSLCCQTTALEPEDCIFDVDQTCFRPVTGEDTTPPADCPVTQLSAQLQAAGYDPALARCHTQWRRSEHITHQDPGLGGDSACKQYEAAGVDFGECVSSLTVADQRGFCLQRSETVQVCPNALSDAQKEAEGIPLDACTQMNRAFNYACG